MEGSLSNSFGAFRWRLRGVGARLYFCKSVWILICTNFDQFHPVLISDGIEIKVLAVLKLDLRYLNGSAHKRAVSQSSSYSQDTSG